MKTIHPFPARMAPELVLRQLPGGEAGLRVLDPMMGSGTTLITARQRGYEAFGIDRDPLAVMIAAASTIDLDSDTFNREALIVLESAKMIARDLPLRDSYPIGADKETRRFIRYWFDSRARRQLAALVQAIEERRFRTKRHLLVAFSRMIITKQFGVSLAWDVSHSRPHRMYDIAPTNPFDFFLKNVAAVARRAHFAKGNSLPPASTRLGDCRDLSTFPADFFDYVITSPPYLNAIDYIRGHKLTLVWLHHSINELMLLRSTNIGAEVALREAAWDDVVTRMIDKPNQMPTRQLNLCRRYARDLDISMREIIRVARPGAKIVLVVGDSTVRGHHVSNSSAISYVARRHGLESIHVIRRPLEGNRRYLPPPSTGKHNDLQRRMSEEVIITGYAS